MGARCDRDAEARFESDIFNTVHVTFSDAYGKSIKQDKSSEPSHDSHGV